VRARPAGVTVTPRAPACSSPPCSASSTRACTTSTGAPRSRAISSTVAHAGSGSAALNARARSPDTQLAAATTLTTSHWSVRSWRTNASISSWPAPAPAAAAASRTSTTARRARDLLVLVAEHAVRGEREVVRGDPQRQALAPLR